jgi:hypothetical protein
MSEEKPPTLMLADRLDFGPYLDDCRIAAARLRRLHFEVERLNKLVLCGKCNDEFTLHDPGTCGNCAAPAPVAQPLTDQQCRDLGFNVGCTEEDDGALIMRLIRAVERAHGITGDES